MSSPVAPHADQPRPRQRLISAALTAVITLGALLAVPFVKSWRPPEEGSPRYRVTGQVGQDVELSQGRVRVTGFTGGKHLGGSISPAIWLVPTWESTGGMKPMAITYVAIRDAHGRLHDAVGCTVPDCPIASPGLRVQCTAAIEIRPEDIHGAELILAPRPQPHGELAVVPIRVTADQVSAWSADDAQVTMPATGLLPLPAPEATP